MYIPVLYVFSHTPAIPTTITPNITSSSPIELSDEQQRLIEQLRTHPPLRPVRTCPTVYVVRTTQEANQACAMLLEQSPPYLSFDTETTVTRRTQPGIPSVIQLANHQCCVIIQIFVMTHYAFSPGTPPRKEGFPTLLRYILETPAILKIGMASLSDALNLNRAFNLQCHGVLDLQHLCLGVGQPHSLAKFASLHAHPVYHDKTTDRRRIWREHCKRYWERSRLTEEEIDYASRDVFAVISALRNFIQHPQGSLLPLFPFLDYPAPKSVPIIPTTQEDGDAESNSLDPASRGANQQ